MATDEELRAQQREAERADAAVWTDFPPTPRWYPTAVGLWAAAMIAAFTLLDGVARNVVVPLGLELGFLAWLLGGGMPAEIAVAARRFLVVPALAVVVVVLAALLGPGWLPPVLTLLAVTPLVARYEPTYAAAAAATRARLA